MKTNIKLMKKFTILFITLVIMLSFFNENIYASGYENDICCYGNRWSRCGDSLKGAFPDFNIVQTTYEPMNYLNRGYRAVEIMDWEYTYLKEPYHRYPLYKVTPIIAVNRNKTNAKISSWSDFLENDLTLGIEYYSENLVIAMNYALEGNINKLKKSQELLAKKKAKNQLLFIPRDGIPIEEFPDAIIMYDNHAKALNLEGANLEIILPSEGTVSYGYSLVSLEPLTIEEKNLIDHFRSYGYSVGEDSYRDIIEINQGVYLNTIRIESMLNRKILKPFRPLRTNKFENAITYVMLLVILGMISVYFYFRISSKSLRNYVTSIFLLLSFWIIVRLLRMMDVNKEIIYRYSWYLYYVALIYVPLIFVWISLSVEERIGPKNLEIFKKVSFVFSSILLIIILTNDYHNLAFKFFDSYDDYSFNHVMKLVLPYYFICIGFSFTVLMVKALKMPKRRLLIIPSIFVAIMVGYIIVFNIFLNNKIAVELTKTVVFIVILIILFSIRYGLIPVNKMHNSIFKNSKISLEIWDSDDNLVLNSNNTKDFELYLMKKKDIRGGFALWYEDLTFLNELFNKEEELNNKLEENLEILKRRYEVEKNLEILSKKEALLETVESAIRKDLVSLDCEIRSLEFFDDERKKKKLSQLALEFVKLKYISNLLITSISEGKIEGRDMEICLNSLGNVAKDLGVDSKIYKKGEGSVSFPMANKMINWFVESIGNLTDRNKEVTCILTLDEDEVVMSLFTDREDLDFNPFTSVLSEDKEVIIEREIELKENEFVYRGALREKKVIS